MRKVKQTCDSWICWFVLRMDTFRKGKERPAADADDVESETVV